MIIGMRILMTCIVFFFFLFLFLLLLLLLFFFLLPACLPACLSVFVILVVPGDVRGVFSGDTARQLPRGVVQVCTSR